MATSDELVGTAEAARILGLTRGGLNRRVSLGQLIPAGRIGKRRTNVFRRAEIEALAAKENQ